MNFNRLSFFTLVCIAALPLATLTHGRLPPSEVKLAGTIPLTTEVLEKMEKFLTDLKSDAAADAEFAAALTESRNGPSMTAEEWGSFITAKCPKTVAVFKSAELTPEDFDKAVHTMEAIIACEGAATAGDPDNLANSEDKTVAANHAFYLANKYRCDHVYGTYSIIGLKQEP